MYTRISLAEDKRTNKSNSSKNFDQATMHITNQTNMIEHMTRHIILGFKMIYTMQERLGKIFKG